VAGLFIHLGGDITILARELVAIVDAKSVAATEPVFFLQRAMADGVFVEIDASDRKSYVITDKTVYASPISSATLRRRAEMPYMAADGESER
jgi:hypothetical protein